MIDEEINIVRQTWSKLTAEKASSVADEFYVNLFQNCPHLAGTLKNDAHEHGKEFIENMNFILFHLDSKHMIREMQMLGIKYASYGIRYEDYECIKKALFHTLKSKLAELWTPTVMVSWVWFFSTVSHIMKYAGNQRTAQAS